MIPIVLKILKLFLFAFFGWVFSCWIANELFDGRKMALRIANIAGAAFLGSALCISLAYAYPGMANIFLSYLSGAILLYAFFYVVIMEIPSSSIMRGFLISIAIIVTVLTIFSLAHSLDIFWSEP